MENNEFNYEIYRKHTVIKLVFMIIGFFLPIIAEAILIPVYQNKLTELGFKVAGVIALVLFEAWVLTKIIIYIRIIISKEFAERKFISLYDERTLFIKQKTNSFTVKFLLYALLLGTVVSGTINQYVFITLVSVAGLLIATYLITYFYYNRKY